MPSGSPHISWASERHLRIEVGHDISPTTHARVQAVVDAISRADPASHGIIDIIPAYATVLLAVDWSAIARDGASRIETAIRQVTEPAFNVSERSKDLPDHASRLVEVPVCYAPAFGLDLADVAAMHGLPPRDIVHLHTSAEYFVHFVGFSPGFAYLGGLPKQLETPRLDKPRVRVPAGSVAVAGSQAGVYPHATPGGWRILGRTSLRMFEARREPASLLRLGDRVRFIEIDEAEFERMERERRQVEAEFAFTRPTSLARGSEPTSMSSPQDGPHIRVLNPGLFATIQDLGRPGHAAQGVPESGATDPCSLRLANRLLGNDDNAAAIELTLNGGEYEFLIDTEVCLTGAAMPAAALSTGGATRIIPHATPTPIRAGERLRLAFARSGARAYLAVRGGLDVPAVLNSRSTLHAAALGGHEGRTLKAGDLLRIRPTTTNTTSRNPPQPLPQEGAPSRYKGRGPLAIRIVDSAHTDRFAPDSITAFSCAEFTVASNSDRMGLRLQGPTIRPPGNGRLLSEGMMWGAIQITESGQPIVLMPDHPTTGGYPVIACVIAADLPQLGQLRPNDRLRFERLTLHEAQACLGTSIPSSS